MTDRFCHPLCATVKTCSVNVVGMLTCSLFYSEEMKVINSVPLDLHLGLKETVKIGNMCKLWLLEHETFTVTY